MNPLCSCNQEIENAEHFFIRCLKYANKRLILFHETREKSCRPNVTLVRIMHNARKSPYCYFRTLYCMATFSSFAKGRSSYD